MSETINTVYDALLMRHIRQAHRYGLTGYGDEQTARSIEIANPLCGDTLTLKRWNTIQPEPSMHLSFECECCGIAMGSASLMTLMLEGVPLVQAQIMAHEALKILRGEPSSEAIKSVQVLPEPLRQDAQGGWQLLTEIAHNLPGRKTCASLAWQALLAELDGQTQMVALEVK
jgi:NifU-like protein involved in Fe-S cluster formation